jgi:hypothetical protein
LGNEEDVWKRKIRERAVLWGLRTLVVSRRRRLRAHRASA